MRRLRRSRRTTTRSVIPRFERSRPSGSHLPKVSYRHPPRVAGTEGRRPMTTIKASCPSCGEVELTSDDISAARLQPWPAVLLHLHLPGVRRERPQARRRPHRVAADVRWRRAPRSGTCPPRRSSPRPARQLTLRRPARLPAAAQPRRHARSSRDRSARAPLGQRHRRRSPGHRCAWVGVLRRHRRPRPAVLGAVGFRLYHRCAQLARDVKAAGEQDRHRYRAALARNRPRRSDAGRTQAPGRRLGNTGPQHRGPMRGPDHGHRLA